jgi:hypothetical protein
MQDNNLFNWTMTYRRDSDFLAVYSKLIPIKDVPQRLLEFEGSSSSEHLPNNDTSLFELNRTSLSDFAIPSVEEFR